MYKIYKSRIYGTAAEDGVESVKCGGEKHELAVQNQYPSQHTQLLMSV